MVDSLCVPHNCKLKSTANIGEKANFARIGNFVRRVEFTITYPGKRVFVEFAIQSRVAMFFICPHDIRM